MGIRFVWYLKCYPFGWQGFSLFFCTPISKKGGVMSGFLMIVGASAFIYAVIVSIFQAICRTSHSLGNGQDMLDIWLGQTFSLRWHDIGIMLAGGLIFIVGAAMKAIPYIQSLR